MASRIPPGSILVSLVRDGDADVVRVAGELDAANIETFRHALTELTSDRVGRGVVDLREVDFMDSSGVHHLLNAQRRLTRQGREFGVLCVPGQVQRLFASLHLERTLKVSCLDGNVNGNANGHARGLRRRR